MKRVIVIPFNESDPIEPIVMLLRKGTSLLITTVENFERLEERLQPEMRFVNNNLLDAGIQNLVIDWWMLV